MLVRFFTSPFAGFTTNRSHCSSASWSLWKAIAPPSGDQTGAAWRWSLMVSWVGQPPAAGTSHRLLRPEMFVTTTMRAPSADHAASPMVRVANSCSIE